jgi:putative membrane protein insertion efficiency factor
MRHALLAALIILAVVFTFDVTRPPASQWTTKFSLSAIRSYQSTLSPLFAEAGYSCRFTLSCSRYAEVVLRRDGFISGGWKTATRLIRCGPWTPKGSVDIP